MFKRLLLTCVAVALLAGCNMDVNKALDAGSDAHKAATLSEAEVKQLGKETAAQLDKQNKVATNNAYAKRLNKIVAGLKNEDGLQLNYKVYMTSDVNAFALPDGSIRVYSGLMDLMKSDDEVFFIIGHEIGHVKNGDSADKMRMGYAASAARKGASAAGGAAGALSDSQLGELGEAVINAQFSQSQESAADVYGMGLLKKYKKNVGAAEASLRKLASLGSSGGMLSSHPDSSKRAEKMAGMSGK